MELLIYGNRKQDEEIWDISTDEKHAAAFLELFKILDEYWKVYEDIPPISRDGDLLREARAGNAASAEKLMHKRRDYEYETYRIAETKC